MKFINEEYTIDKKKCADHFDSYSMVPTVYVL